MNKNIRRVLASVSLSVFLSGISVMAFGSEGPIPVTVSSSQASQGELPAGTPVTPEEAKEIISNINKTMESLQSVTYTVNSKLLQGNQQSSMSTASYVDFENQEIETEVNYLGVKTNSYSKEGRTYVKDLENNVWKYTESDNIESTRKSALIGEGSSSFLTVEKLPEGGYVLKTQQPLSSKELSVLTGKEQASAQETSSNTTDMKGAAFYIVDENFHITQAHLAIRIFSADNSVVSQLNTDTEYSGFNEKKEISFPEELEEAELLTETP